MPPLALLLARRPSFFLLPAAASAELLLLALSPLRILSRSGSLKNTDERRCSMLLLRTALCCEKERRLALSVSGRAAGQSNGALFGGGVTTGSVLGVMLAVLLAVGEEEENPCDSQSQSCLPDSLLPLLLLVFFLPVRPLLGIESPTKSKLKF